MKNNSTLYLRYAITVIFLLSITFVYAGNYTWNGSQSGSWATAANWTPNGVPSTSDTINVNSGHPTLLAGQNRTIARIVISGGTIDVGSYELYVTERASLNGGDINNGNLKIRGTYAFFQGTNFDCTLDVISAQIKLSGGTFQQATSFEHTGSASGWGEGGCVFNAAVTVKNSGASYLRMGQTNGDVFNGDVTFSCTGTYALQLCYGDTSSYNGNVYLNCTNSGGLNFCTGTGSAAILASGKTIAAGSSGLTAGVITLKGITQNGSTAQTFTTTGSTTLNVTGCVFNGAATFSAPSLLVKTSTFNSTSSFTKTGNAANHWEGGNLFNGATTINNNTTGSGVLRMALQTGDIYVGDVSFNTSSGYIQVAFADTNEFRGNITINNAKVSFNNGSGILQCTSGNAQTFSGAASFLIGKLWMNKSANGLTLQKATTIDSILTLTSGIVFTDSTNLLTLKAGGITSGASNVSYIDGPMKKVGNTAFVFPVGKEHEYRSLLITSISSATDVFQCEYFEEGQQFGNGKDSLLISINECEYWKLKRISGSSVPQITLNWNENSCFVTSPSKMKVSFWNGTLWKDGGNSAYTGNSILGSVTSINNITSEYFTLANELDTSQIPILSILEDVALMSIHDSITAPGMLHISGDVVSKKNLNVQAFKNIEEGDSLFSIFSNELRQNHEILNGKDFNQHIIADGDTITVSGYYKLAEDSIIRGLTIYGDSLTKIFIRCNPQVLFLDSAVIKIAGVPRKNIVWIVKKASFFKFSEVYGTIYSNSVFLDSMISGAFQLFAINSISINNLNGYNNRIYLKAWNYLSEDIRDDYNSINPLTLPCNKILNGDLELGVLPISTGGIMSLNANNWDATQWKGLSPNACNSATSSNNTPDLFDKSISPSLFLSCANGQIGGLGIPSNFVSNGIVDVRLSGTKRYFHCIDKEAANVQLASALIPSFYLLEFYHAFSNCNTPMSGSYVYACIGLLPNLPNTAVTPLILNSGIKLSTLDWNGNAIPTGTWSQNLFCVDLSTYPSNYLSTFNRIGIKPEYQGSSVYRDVFFDDFSLVKLSDAGGDQTICSGSSVQIGDLDNCLSIISGISVSYLWSAVPAYSWSSGQETQATPIVAPTQTTTFTLTVTVTYPDGTSTCSDIDDADITVTTGQNPSVIFNLNSPYSLCQGQSVSLCTTGTFSAYNWSTGATTQCISVSSAGTYTLTVTDQSGCTGQEDIVINVIPCCSLSVNLSSQIPCSPTQNGSISGTLSNGIGPYLISWQQIPTGLSGTFNIANSTFSISNLPTGNYSILITDANNCTTSGTAAMFISNGPAVPIITGTNTVCSSNPVYTISNAQQGNGVSYAWSFVPAFSTPGSTVSFSPSSGSTTTATYNGNSNYMLMVVATDQYGCTSSSQFAVNQCCPNSEYQLIDEFSSDFTNGYFSNFTIEGIFTVNSNTIWLNKTIIMGPGAEIKVQPGNTLSIINTSITPCISFWKSISLSYGSRIIVDNSLIQGGQYAIDVNSGAGYTITNNSFLYDNYISLRVTGPPSNLLRRIEGTVISMAPGGTSLYNTLSDYIGQSPATRNAPGCIATPNSGIRLSFANVNQIGSLVINKRNYISDAIFGINSTNTFLRVVQTTIENIQNDLCQPANAINGSAIYATTSSFTGNIYVYDNNSGSGLATVIKNCRIGIRTNNLAPIVRNCNITQVSEGIRSTNLPSHFFANKMEVSNNVIEFGQFGVRVLNPRTTNDFHLDIHFNDLFDYNNNLGIGGVNGSIIINGQRILGELADISGNAITLSRTPFGIMTSNLSDVGIGSNEINLNLNNWQRGIFISGSDDILAINNLVTGTPTSLPVSRFGVYMSACGIVNRLSNLLQCNDVINCSRDFWFDLVNSNVDFRQNILEGGRDGLYLTSAVMGNQNDKFNKWCGSFVNSSVYVDPNSYVTFQIPAITPLPPYANCEYDPFAIGNILGAGSVSIDYTGSPNDPGCDAFSLVDTSYVTDFDIYVADSLANLDIDENVKYQYRRLLGGKLAFHPDLIEQDSSINSFWETYQDSDEVVLAGYDQKIRNLLSEDEGYFDSAHYNAVVLDQYLEETSVIDSLIVSDSTGTDSLTLLRREELMTGIDSLVHIIDSLVKLGNENVSAVADAIREELIEREFDTPQGQAEKEYQLFRLRYGSWSAEVISEDDTSLITGLAMLCAREYGPAVIWARGLYTDWYDEVIMDEDVCEQGSRMTQNTENSSPVIRIELIPNPANDVVAVRVSGVRSLEMANSTISFIDLAGELVSSSKITGIYTNLAINDLKPGMYIARIDIANQRTSFTKLVVVR